MQKFLRTLMLAALMLPFASQAQTLPFTEGFGTSIPTGWSMYTGLASNVFNGTAPTSVTSGWNFGGNNGLTDNHARVNIYGTSCNKWLVTPSINLTGVANPQLSVDLAFTAYSGAAAPAISNIADDKFMVIISTDDGATWSEANATKWMVADSVTAGVADYDITALPYASFQTFTIDLTPYAGSTIKIAFYAESTVTGGDNNLHIDNVYVGAPITCFKVTDLAIDATATTSSSLTLTWSDALNTSATYSVYSVAPTGNTLVQSGISGLTYTVTGLDANTAYTYAVMTDCGAGDVSELTASVSGRTACAAMSLPYTMGFEVDEIQSTAMATALPWCSMRYVSRAATSGTNYPYSYSSYANTGSRSFWFYGVTTATYPDTQAVVLPQVDVTAYPMNGNRVAFWARMSGASYTKAIYVATLSDPNDMSTLTVIDSVIISGTTYNRYTVSLATSPANNAYVVLAVLGRTTGSVYVDDLVLEEAPSCPDMTRLAVSGVTNSSIMLGWDIVEGANTYTVYNMADNSIVGTATDTTYDVTGLNPNTQYTFGVRANCASGDGSMLTVSARTACAAVTTLPYVVDFEDATVNQMPSCWERPGGTGVYVSNSYAHGGSNALRFYSGSNRYAVMPEITIPSDGLQVKFWTRPESNTNSSCADFQVGYMTNVADITTFVAVETYHYNDWTSATHEERTVNMTNLPAGARIAFYHTGTNNWYWFLDDITVDNVPSCLAPSGLAASSITSSGATLTWNGTADSYTVYNMADTSLVTTVTTNSYNVTGLNANTAYTFGVVSNCGTESSDIATVNLTTACGAETMPWSENFDNWTAKSPCWSFLSGAYNMAAGTPTTTTSGWDITSNYGNITLSGKALAFNLYGTNRYWVVTPAVSITSATAMLSVDVAVAGWSSATTNYDADDTLAFAASTDGGTTWTNLMTLDGTALNALGNTYTTVNVPVDGYNGQDVRFAIFGGSTASGGDNRIAIDNVTVDEAPSCLAVTDLTIDSVSANSVLLSWSDAANTGATYTVYNGTTQVATNVANTSYEVTGLTASTAYTFGVVANCSATDASTMVTIDAATACEGGNCTITIVGTDSYGDGWANDYADEFSTITISQNGAAIGTFTLTSGSSNTETYSVCGSMPVSFSWTSNSDYDDEADFIIYNGNNDSVYADNGATLAGLFFTLNNACSAVIDTTTPSDTTGIAITIAVNDATMGTTVPAPGTYTYAEGETMTVTAMPNAGYHVSDWTMTIEGQAMSLQTDTTTISDVIASYYDGLIITAVFAADVIDTTGNDTTIVGCNPIALPFIEDFEANSTTYNCWSQNNMASGSGPSTMKYYSGAQSFGFQYTTEPPAYLISPELTGTDNGVQVEFSYAIRSNSYPESFQVGYSTTTNAPAAFTWGTEQTNLTNTNFERYSEIFGVSGIKYVAVKYTAYDAWTLYIDSLVVKEAPSCTPVMALAVDSATANSIFLSWTSSNNSATYTIYNMADTSVVASGVTATSYTVTGLTASTGYTFGVQAICSATDSANMVTISATTDCSNGSCNITIATTNSYGLLGASIDVMQNGGIVANITDNSWSDIIETVKVCSGAPVALVWNEGVYDSYVSFTVTDGGGATVYTCTSGSDMTDGATFATINDPCPSCVMPAVTLDSISETTATISWTSSASSFDVYNGETLVQAGVTANTYTFTGLTNGTTYTFGVQAICSATDSSALATLTATTVLHCEDITTLPYSEGFENGFGCWTTVNGSSDGMPWFAIQNQNSIIAHSGTGMAVSVSYYSGAVHANSWLISPKVVLPATTTDTLKLSWWFRVNGAYPDDKYEVRLSTTTNDTASFTTQLFNILPDSTNNDWSRVELDLSAYAGQDVYVAFHHYDSYDADLLIIDDIEIFQGAYVPPAPDTLVVVFATNDTAMGTTVPAPGTYYYTQTDTIFFGSTANSGYLFDHWDIDRDGAVTTLNDQYANGYYVLAASWINYDTVTFTANFVPMPDPDTLTVTFTVNDTAMGTTNPAPGTYQYLSTDTVHFSAVPNAGYHFMGWVMTVGTETDTVDADYISAYFLASAFTADSIYSMTLEALFEAGSPDSTTVTYAVNDASMGSITPAAGTYTVYVGDAIEAEATANTGYRLSAWAFAYDVAGTPYASDTLYANEEEFANPMNFGVVFQSDVDNEITFTVTAIFEAIPTYTVTTNVAPENSGSVTGAPTAAVLEGTTLVLTAVPAAGYHFVNWSNGLTEATISVVVMSDTTLTANFEVNAAGTYSVTVTYDATMGTVTGIPASPVESGTEVTLTATALDGYHFVNWSTGDTTETITVTVTSDTVLSVTFEANVELYTFTITSDDETMGIVTGSGEYHAGDQVTIQAIANDGYRFVRWSDGNTEALREIIVTGDLTLVAYFVAVEGIDDVEGENVNIYSAESRIIVKGAENSTIYVYDVNGRVVRTQANATETVEFTVPSTGVYLVKVGNAPAKRVVVVR